MMEGYDGRQEAVAGRYRRPESSLSDCTRLTPQSSNTSSANLPQRWNIARSDRERGNVQDGRAASLLQEKIREKKAARMNDDGSGLDVDSLHDIRGVQSSPLNHGSTIRPTKERDGLRPGSSGKMAGERLGGKKGMGVKEMEETVSTLHKQNFDLKLELFHRRQRQTELEERLEAAEAQLSDHLEMQRVNEQLLAELEKRDQAVEEAVGIICTLEEQVSELLRDRGDAQSSDEQHLNDYFRDFDSNGAGLDLALASSPPPLNRNMTRYPRSVPRMPSFLSDRSEGAEALRSLYLSPDPAGPNVVGLPRLVDGNHHNQMSEGDGMDSPRLSVLSESSFISVYGDKKLNLSRLDLNERSAAPSPNDQRHRKSESVEKWIEEGVDKKLTTHRPTLKRGSFGAQQFLSINDVLESPLQRLEKLHRTLERQNNKRTSVQLLDGPATSERRFTSEKFEKEGKTKDIRRTEVETFGNQEALPPTPDTISTSTLRHFKNSTDNLNRDVGDLGLILPFFDKFQPASLYRDQKISRPHSAGETITSRREGHGWDTVTQSEYTDNASDTELEVPSSLDPWIHTGGQKSTQSNRAPPDLFKFGADDNEWGRDMMFNRDSRLQSRSQKRLELKTTPRFSPALTPTTPNDRSGTPYLGNSTQITPPIHALPQPNPPTRSSSLAASSPSPPTAKSLERRRPKQARPPPAPSASYNTAMPRSFSASAISPEKDKETKRSRITSKIFSIGFGGSTSSPLIGNDRSPNYADQSSSLKNHKSRNRSVDLPSAIRDSASATPPPISRYPKNNSAGGGRASRELVELKRPSTRDNGQMSTAQKHRSGMRDSSSANGERNWVAGTMEGYGLGIDGSADAREQDANGNQQTLAQQHTPTPGRKWFGLGRNGSLKH